MGKQSQTAQIPTWPEAMIWVGCIIMASLIGKWLGWGYALGASTGICAVAFLLSNRLVGPAMSWKKITVMGVIALTLHIVGYGIAYRFGL